MHDLQKTRARLLSELHLITSSITSSDKRRVPVRPSSQLDRGLKLTPACFYRPSNLKRRRVCLKRYRFTARRNTSSCINDQPMKRALPCDLVCVCGANKHTTCWHTNIMRFPNQGGVLLAQTRNTSWLRWIRGQKPCGRRTLSLEANYVAT